MSAAGDPGRPGGLRRFRTGDPVSLAIGLWPVLEALHHRPDDVEHVAWHPDLAPAVRARLLAAARAASVPADEDAATVARARRAGTALVVAHVRRPDDVLDDDRDHVVLLQPAHAGNVGAALRTALGFGLRDMALVGGRVDPWSPHVLRASQGAAFAVRHRAWGTWAGYRAAHPRHAVVAVTTPAPDAVP
ncbi:MAG: TrmH family RNA methyltransferase, partial [Trueperaceae bacterium]|nr:TrmH family RNA methyltransferase [Trueperaceae bacterium]